MLARRLVGRMLWRGGVSMLIGGDPDQLDALGNQMDAWAQTLDQIRVRVGGVLEQLLWQGADAREFFEQWADRFAGMVGAAASGLREASQCMHAEASQQRGASDGNAGFNILEPAGLVLTGLSLAGDATKLLKYAVVSDGLKALGATDDGLEAVKSLAETVDVPLAGLGFEVNAESFLLAYSAHPQSAETLKDGFDTALSFGEFAAGVGAMAAVGTAAAPVLGGIALGLGLAGAGNDVVSHFDPRFDEQTVHVAEAATSAGLSGVRDVWTLVRRNPLNWVPVL